MNVALLDVVLFFSAQPAQLYTEIEYKPHMHFFLVTIRKKVERLSLIIIISRLFYFLF